MTSYGQFCPLAKAMELLDQRWTLLVVRELLAGSTHFNELRRGVPKMSPALLSTRLRALERAGVVRRDAVGGRATYRLTPCGQELAPVVQSLGLWGLRWIGELGSEDLDPHLLMWDIRRTVPIDRWPRSRTVVEVRLVGVPARSAGWWIVVANGDVDVCDADPGYDVTATVSASLLTLTRIWRGELAWSQAVRTGAAVITGPAQARRAVPDWIGQSALASAARAG